MNEIIDYEGYILEPRLINLYKATIVSFIFFVLYVALYGVPFGLLWDLDGAITVMKNNIHSKDSNVRWIYGIVIVAGIAVHELIHGVVFAFFAKKGIKSVKFGIVWKMLTPYAHCKEPLPIRSYMLGVIMPFILLGFLPGIYAIFTGNLPLLFFAIFFSGAAVGDFMILNLIYKENKDNLVLDHPTEGGCFILKKVM